MLNMEIILKSCFLFLLAITLCNLGIMQQIYKVHRYRYSSFSISKPLNIIFICNFTST